jgi:hypothetical protein
MTTDRKAPTKGGPTGYTPVEEAPEERPAEQSDQLKAQPPAQPAQDRSSLYLEAERLGEFKKRKIKNNNQTPCPACATPVHIDANLCPHCSSDIAANNALVRESMRRLDEINSQLGSVRGHAWISRLSRLIWPIREKARAFFSDPRVREDLKVLIPSLVAFFALILVIRALGNGFLFWAVTIVGGVVAYSLLGRRSEMRNVTMDLYRMALVFGLVLVMTITVVRQTSLTAGTGSSSVTVESRIVNIRSAASTDSRVVTQVNQGDRLRVIERGDTWYKVKTPDGKTGWVFANLVKD